MIKRVIVYLLSLMNLRISKIPEQKPEPYPEWLAQGIEKLQLLKKYNFNTVIDVGANEGYFASIILKVFPNAQVHSFEPLQNVFEKLKANFLNNKNVSVYNFGLGEKD